MEPTLGGAVVGLAVFLFPGAAWTAALAPRLPRPIVVPVAVLVAFTLAPATLYLLALLFDVPLRQDTMGLLCVALGMAGVAARLRPALASRLGP